MSSHHSDCASFVCLKSELLKKEIPQTEILYELFQFQMLNNYLKKKIINNILAVNYLLLFISTYKPGPTDTVNAINHEVLLTE